MPTKNICDIRQVAAKKVDTAFDDEYAKLREIVVGEERDGLEELRLRFDEFEHGLMKRVGGRFVEALEARSKNDPDADEDLGVVLRGPVEHAIRSSISHDRAELSKSLFPIMGPATRDYVSSLFRGMVEDLNEVIHNTTSIKRLKWRAEAKLSGKPYSEYLLLKTLNYRVEEIFLMQPNTGMLLQHIAVKEVDEDRDADLVSGMFSAIRSFVQDSFNPNSGKINDGEHDNDGDLAGFTFGNRKVIIEASPSAIIAASVDGTPPPHFRSQLEGILEELQANHVDQLDQFSGDADEMAFTQPILQPAMIENRAKESEGGGLWRAWLALGIIVVALATWGVLSWQKEQRIQKFLAEIEAQPGIEAVRISDGDQKQLITGMRDPLAVDPQQLALDAGFERDAFDYDFVPYLSVGTSFDEQRRAEVISKEERMRMTLTAEMVRRSRALAMAQLNNRYGTIKGLNIQQGEQGQLKLSGTVSEPNYSDIQRGAQAYSEVFSTIDGDKLKNATPAKIEQLSERIRNTQIKFISGLPALDEGALEEISRISKVIIELGNQTQWMDQQPNLVLHTGPLIGENLEYLEETARDRLLQVREILIENGVPEEHIAQTVVDEERHYGESSRSVYLVPSIIQLNRESP